MENLSLMFFTLLRQIKVLSKDNGWIEKRKEGKGRKA